MSGEPTNDDPTEPATDNGLPSEVEAPEPALPAPTPLEELEQKLAVLAKEQKETWDRYVRTAADLDNTRKRQKRELDDARFEAKQRVLREILPVVDNLERAIDHASGQADQAEPATSAAAAQPIVEGVQLVLRQLLTAFERLEVTPIDPVDQPFDPNLHEAISQQESDKPPGSVVQVLQRGYRAGDRLLRPALVVVAKPRAEPPAA